MIVLDASVLIGHLARDDPHHERAERLLLRWAHEPMAASVITLAEILVDPARAGREADARQVLSRLGVEEVPLADGAASRLAGLRAATGLKLPDCCVILAAQEVGASIATFDDRLEARAAALGIYVVSPS